VQDNIGHEIAYYQISQHLFDGWSETLRRPIETRFATGPAEARADLLYRWRSSGDFSIVCHEDGSIERDAFPGVKDLEGARTRIWWEPLELPMAGQVFNPDTVKPGNVFAPSSWIEHVVTRVTATTVTGTVVNGDEEHTVPYSDIRKLIISSWR